MLRPCALSLLLLAVACGPPPEVTLKGPEALTLFGGDSVALPLTLHWEGEPRLLTLSGTSGTGLSVSSAQASDGDTHVLLSVTAADGATSGPLVITATGEGVESTLTVPVSIATASLVSSSPEPLLRGAHAVATIAVSDPAPLFEGAASSEPVAEGQWRVRIPVPAEATVGKGTLPLVVRVGDSSASLSVPVTVVDAVTVTVRDLYDVGLPGHQVFVNSTGPVVTDADGQAIFAGVTAPYRLSVHRTLTNTSAETYEDVTLASPVVLGQETNLPERTTTLEVRLEREATRELLTGHQTAWVHVMVEGQPYPDGVSFVAGGNQSTKTVRWRSEATRVRSRLRAIAYQDGKIAWYSDHSTTLDATDADAQYLIFPMRPPEHGVIRTSLQVPPGYSVESKSLEAVFAGNRFDHMGVTGDDSPALAAELDGALVRDDVRHTLTVYASDLAGHYVIARWVGLAIGDTAAGALQAPPAVTGVGAQINDRTQYVWSGPSWPVYRLTLNAGEGGAARSETIFTSRSAVTRAALLPFPAATAGAYQGCGSTHLRTVDDLLRGDGNGFHGSLMHAGAAGCDLRREVTYTGP